MDIKQAHRDRAPFGSEWSDLVCSFRSSIDSLEDESFAGESSEAPLLDRKSWGVTWFRRSCR